MTLTDSLRVAYRLVALRSSQWWPEDRIKQYQRGAIVNALRHAIETVPHYRSLGLSAEKISSIADLQRFPILTKQDVQALGDNLLSDSYSRPTLKYSMTSGTSGEPTTTYFDDDCWLLSKYALKIRRMLGNGLGPFKRIVVISEQRPDQLRRAERLAGSSLLFDQRMLSIHDPVSSHVETFLRNRIDAVYAFPSYFSELINYCEANNISLGHVPVIFTSSEVLRDSLRSRIETCFGGRVCDVYGGTEFKEIAWQCDRGSYHLNFESVYLENAPCQAGDSADRGDVLVTSIANRAMPLIRYRIGDECTLSWVDCGCGRSSPSLSNIGGRIVDMVRLPNGDRLSPYLLTTTIEAHSEISKYQIVQTAKDDIELRYVPKTIELPTADVESMRSALRIFLGESMTIRVKSVPTISRSRAGKHRVFVQDMKV